MPDRYDPFDPEQNRDDSSWDKNWDSPFTRRVPGLWYRPNEIAYFKKSDTLENAPFISHRVAGRADVPLEDQRGLTLPELDLQARFQKLRGLGPWAESGASFDPAAHPSEMERAAGVNDIESATKAIALRHAGEVLSMHAPEGQHPELPSEPPTRPPKKATKKKEVK